MVENITLVNTVTGDSIQLSATDTIDYILESVDWGNLVSKVNTCRFIGQVGSTPTDIIIQERAVAIIGWIVSGGDELIMKQRKDRLNSFFNPKQLMRILYEDYILDFLPSTTVQYGSDDATNNEVMAKFQLSGTAYDPLFRDNKESVFEGVEITPVLRFPLVIPSGGMVLSTKARNIIFDVVNNGNVPVGMRVVFKASGAVVNPYLLNLNTQEYIKITKRLVSGELVEVTTVTGQKNIVGTLNGVQSNYFKYLDINGSWIQLAVGDNVFRFGADSGETVLDVNVFYTSQYMEVEGCY